MGASMVEATAGVYHEIMKELKPTPKKSHYQFNLRDVSKVFQGILMGNPSGINDPEVMSKIWIRETMRVFHDRLINQEDRSWLTHYITEVVQTILKLKWEHKDIFEDQQIYFGDFMKRGLDVSDRKYDIIDDFPRLEKVMGEYIQSFNIDHPTSKLQLVLFTEALSHLTRICRILRQE